jgi:hypothetical protein
LFLQELVFFLWSVSYVVFAPGYSNTRVFQVAKDVRASRDNLSDLFNRIGYFFRRLEVYTRVPPTTAMTNIAIEIMAEILVILAIATDDMKRGRLGELIGLALDPDSHFFREISEEAYGKHRC